MRKKNCFKKLGAVIMAVAMTAMMIPGVVSAKLAEPIESITLNVAAPEVGKPIPTLAPIEDIPNHYSAVFSGTETASQGNIVLGWVQNKEAATGTFEAGKEYTCMFMINALSEYQITENTKITIAGKEAELVDSRNDTQFNVTYLFYGVNFKLEGEKSETKIVDGDGNETISSSSDKDLVLKCEKDLPDEGFKFYFGGKELTSNECKVEKGSTIVTVYASYLDTLPGGDYEVTFSYPDGNITNTVTLTKAAAEKKAPQTGEFSSMATTLLLISILGLVGLGFYAKKKEFF